MHAKLRAVFPLFLLAFLWFVPHLDARADDIEQAYAKCQTELSHMTPDQGYSVISACAERDYPPPYNGTPVGVFVTTFTQYGSGPNEATNWAFYVACATGETFNRTSGQCEAPFDSSQCLAHNAEDGFKNVGDTVRTFECANVGGCEFKAVGPHVGYKSGGQMLFSGHFEFTGNAGSACTTNKPATDPTLDDAKQQKTQDCVPAGSGMTMCIKSNGDHCASASTGRQICWHPTEVGTKTDGSTVQQRNGGNTPASPPPPPPGDTLTQTSTTTGTTTQTNSTGSTSTSTTTITNYTTGSGADGNTGGTNDGESNTGDGSGKDGGDHGSASGGIDCTTPPTLTPGDNPLEAHLDNQVWLMRCQNWTEENPKVDAAKATVQAQEDAWNNNMSSLDADGFEAYYNAHKSDTPTNAGGASVIDKSSIDTTGLDASGFLSSGSCPLIPDLHVGTAVIPINFDAICGLLAGFGNLVIALAYFIAAKMIATS